MRVHASLVSVLILGTLGFTIAQEQIPSKDEILQKVPELANIPGFANFNTSAVKTEDVQKLIREKCEKNGGPTAFDVAKESPGYLTNCIQSLVNMTQLQDEMAAARPKGDLDTVFKKYCNKVPSLKRCVKNVTDSFEPCLEAEERNHVKIIHNITSSLLQFICHNEGDRIAMFIAAGGVECFKAQQEAVQVCANETFSSYVPAAKAAGDGISTLSEIPLLVLGVKECTDIDNFGICTVKVLEECNDPTPANVVESLFKFVKRVTPCKTLVPYTEASPNAGTRIGQNGSNSLPNIVNVLLITGAMALSLRFG